MHNYALHFLSNIVGYSNNKKIKNKKKSYFIAMFFAKFIVFVKFGDHKQFIKWDIVGQCSSSSVTYVW